MACISRFATAILSAETELALGTIRVKTNSYWTKACEHVLDIELLYWEKEGLIDEIIERLRINLEDLESEDGSFQVSSYDGRKANNFPMKRTITPLIPYCV